MLRKRFLWAIALSLSFGATSRADTFFTGRADFNGSLAGGVNVLDAKRTNFDSGAISYSNVFTAAAPPAGQAAVGNKVNTIGYVVLSSATVGNTTTPFGTSNRITAVYALQGTITNANPLSTTVRYDSGTVRVYDRGVTTGINNEMPSQWVTNIANLNQGVIATLGLDGIPTAVLQGPPDGLLTESLVVVDPSAINSAKVNITAAVGNTADLLFNYLSGPFVTDFDVVDPKNPQLFVRLNETLQSATFNPNQTDLNTIFNAFLPGKGPFSTIGTGTGSDFGPGGLGNPDTTFANDGGFAVPGATQVEIPEPASMLVWGLIAGGCGVYGGFRRFRARKTSQG